MLTDGRTDGRTGGRTDGRKVITIAHPEQSSGELKTVSKALVVRFNTCQSSISKYKMI